MKYHVTVAGRAMTVTVTGVLADCRDAATGYESQAILGASVPSAQVLADSQVRDALRSAYYNATSREAGTYPTGGTVLPENFTITMDYAPSKNRGKS